MCSIPHVLTHWGRVMHICVGNQTIIGSDNGLAPGTAPSHYLNQCSNIVNWTLRNKLQWNLNQNSCVFIHENAFENVVWKMAAILSRPQCADTLLLTHNYVIKLFWDQAHCEHSGDIWKPWKLSNLSSVFPFEISQCDNSSILRDNSGWVL